MMINDDDEKVICVKGYLNNQAADTDYFTQDGFATMGDLGYYDEEGRLYFKDRIKEVIKVGNWIYFCD